jgi:hypothetical protein
MDSGGGDVDGAGGRRRDGDKNWVGISSKGSRDRERRCDDPWTLGIDKSGEKKSRSTRGAHKHRVRMQHVTI